MSLRSRVLPSLINGISRQPPILRSLDQNEDELNTWVRLIDGVGRRPPTEFIAEIADGPLDDAFVHHINRDTSERYLVIVKDGEISVWDHETGTPCTVNAPGGLEYIAGDPANLRAFTAADYTFIVNTSKVCAMAPAGADEEEPPEYYRMPSSRPQATNGILADMPPDDGYYTGGEYQYPPNPTLGTLTGEVASIEKLPEEAAEGALYKVSGASSSAPIASFYVVRRGAVWDETVGPGLTNSLDALTMPHALVREADGTFSFAPFSWAPRRVGDDATNPRPTFVGRTINGLFFYQNRLGFLSDENVVFSVAGDFGNFWRSTVLDYLDGDVIDVAASSTGADGKVSILRNVVAFSDGLLATSDQTQFSLTNGEDGLTASSVAVRAVTHYEVNNRVRPAVLGTEVYFLSDGAGGTSAWEYTRPQTADATSAAEITAHVKGLVPAGVRTMSSAPDLNALFLGLGDERLFVYQLYWDGNEKAMSSWRRWTLPGDVLATSYIDGRLYCLVERDAKVSLQRIDLRLLAKPPQQPYPVHLDRLVTLEGVYDAESGRTTFELPYSADTDRVLIVRGEEHPTAPGGRINPDLYEWTGSDTVSVPGDESVSTCCLGERFRSHIVFSRQYPVNYQNQPLATGRLQLRTFTVNYALTGSFVAEVKPYGDLGEDSPSQQNIVKRAQFTGRTLGDSGNRLNQPANATASYTFTVYGDASKAQVSVWTDDHGPATFVSAEWEGFYFSRAHG
ncbi:hypothetical protein [Sphingomonas sp.]|uniref:phage nozzle protein n=1 Tax=Sphingomonas sp. TaxID=28214 RepID=UPI002ED8E7FC